MVFSIVFHGFKGFRGVGMFLFFLCFFFLPMIFLDFVFCFKGTCLGNF